MVNRRPYAVAARTQAALVEAAGRKRPVISARFLPASCNCVFCAQMLFFILGPSEKGGSIAPLSFPDELILSQLENRYYLCSPLILDLPTALIQVLILTHVNL